MRIGSFKPFQSIKKSQRELSFKPKYSRTRTDGMLVNETYQMSQVHGVTHPASSVVTEPWSIPYGLTRTMTDWVTPGYLYILRNGGIVNTPAYSVVEKYQPSIGSRTVIGTVPGTTDCTNVLSGYVGAAFEGYGEARIHPSNLTNLVDANWLVNKAVIDVHSRVEEPKTLSLVTAAEFGKTVNLLATSARTIANVIRLAKSGGTSKQARKALGRDFKLAPVKTSVQGAAKRWLEWRYGWGPLLMDINGTLQAISSGNFVQKRKIVRGSSEQEKRSERLLPGTYVPGNRPNHGSYSLKFIETEKVSVRSYILYEADLKFQPLSAFGVQNLASTAWELIPFSFVLDWFIPIGDWIQAMEPKLGVRYLASGYTVTRLQSLRRDVVGFVAPNTGDGHNYIELLTLIGHSDLYERTTRHRSTHLPDPLQAIVDVKLNKKRFADAIALMVALRR